jgi:hypothetical protein
MYIEKVLKTQDGTFKFEGELTDSEHDYVLTVGLNYLLQQGVLPFKAVEDDNLKDMVPGDDNYQ